MTHDVELYATDRVQDALGDGLRIHTSWDEVYETRRHDDAAIRIYPAEGRWHARVQYDVTELEDAYDRFSAAASGIADAYEVSLDTTPKAFMADLDSDGLVREDDGRYTLTFREEPDIRSLVNQPVSGKSWLKGMAASMASLTGGGSTVGAVLGGALGIPGGPPAMAAGATAGAVGGGVLGGIVGFSETLATASVSEDRYMWRSSFPTNAWTRFFEKRRRKKYVDEGRLAEETHFDLMNRLNTLDRELELADSLDLARHEEYTDLDESGVDEVHDILMRTQFHDFEKTGGVTATRTAETYEEAAAFAAELLDVDAPDERPSIYTDPAVFRDLFDQCSYEDDGEERLFGTGHAMMQDVVGRDAVDPSIVTWLEERHPGLVKEVGQEHALSGGER